MVNERLDYLELIPAFCHERNLPRDASFQKHSVHNVRHGDEWFTVILNRLGFHSRILRLISKRTVSSILNTKLSNLPKAIACKGYTPLQIRERNAANAGDAQ
ncbi:DUF4277 domain-containing protein [Vibrio breoganii]|uniref:DUF4277 domain-containing protein n=1 Tax=Vibrio breoganii TaxID=553239 RepID=UPI003BB206DA